MEDVIERGVARTSVRLAAIVLGLALSTPSAAADVAVSDEPTPPFLTLAFGRTQWVTTSKCRSLANTVPLDVVADAMARRGLVGTGNVVVARTLEHEQLCWNGYTLHPSWDQLGVLRDTYGWTFISASVSYPDMTTLTQDAQRAESCGSLPAFEAHGHARAWGLFAYPNDRRTDQIQRDVVSTCFAYGRTYLGGRNSRSAMGEPWFQATNDVSGGRCNDPSLPCSKLATPKRYWSRLSIASLFDVAPDEWAVVQMYRFVKGRRLSGVPSWDCTAADWRAHWTSQSELYCWNDFRWALDRIPADVTTVDPATVAEAWGRTPG